MIISPIVDFLQALEQKLLELNIVDNVKMISQIDGLKGFNGYAIAYELLGDQNYKDRKGIHETPVLLNLYSNVDNGDVAVLWLREQVIDLLDESELVSDVIKTYMIKYIGGNPRPERNSYLQAWQCVAQFLIRWEGL